MENGDLLQEEQGEDGVEGLPDLLLFGACEVAGDGAKKDLRDQEADFSPSGAKAISRLNEITEGEPRFQQGGNLEEILRGTCFGKLSQMFLNFPVASTLARIASCTDRRFEFPSPLRG